MTDRSTVSIDVDRGTVQVETTQDDTLAFSFGVHHNVPGKSYYVAILAANYARSIMDKPASELADMHLKTLKASAS